MIDIERLLEPIRRRIRLIVGRGVVGSVHKPEGSRGPSVDISLLGDEKRSYVPFMQHYGVMSVPKNGSEVTVLFIGGSRDNGLAVASLGDVSKLPELNDGEVCLYSEFGQTVVLKNDGSIVMLPASGKAVRVESDLNVTGKVLAVGEVATGCVDAGGTFSDAAAIHLKTHMHPTAAIGSPSPPTPGS